MYSTSVEFSTCEHNDLPKRDLLVNCHLKLMIAVRDAMCNSIKGLFTNVSLKKNNFHAVSTPRDGKCKSYLIRLSCIAVAVA